MLDNLRYLGRLAAGVLRPSRPRRRGRLLALLVAGAGVSVVLYGHVPGVGVAGRPKLSAADVLQQRAQETQVALTRVEDVYEEEVAPIARVLQTYRDDPVLTSRIAVALVREARRVELPPRLLMAVLLVENPWLDPGAASFVGAQGLMQVMPFWRGNWKACGRDLNDIDENICHGARIFATYLRSERGNVERALLRYNGCVKGTNTPNCHQYANHVFARAGRASLLAWKRPGMAAAP